MTRSFRITPRAESDLKKIASYTLKTWGRRQRNKYLLAMERRFIWLAENAELGKHRTDIHEDYYSYPQGSHVIFYMIRDDFVDIIGVVHQRMDIIKYFLG
jgi:toxin ParE1/3/4